MRGNHILTLLVLGLFTLSPALSWSQQMSKKEAKKAEKERAEQQMISKMKFTPIQQALRDGAFALEADHIQSTGGKVAYVTATNNYVMMSEGQSTVQLAFNNLIPGLNSAGGIAVSGEVVDMETRISKKGTITLQYTIMGGSTKGPMDVVITLPAGGNYASARVKNSINFSGKLLPISRSNVYKGREVISVPRGLTL